MKSCYKCGNELLYGLIVCRDCKDESGLPLAYYIDQLAEDIVLDHPGASCSLCIRGECHQQQRGLTCRNNIKRFLEEKIDTYSDKFSAISDLPKPPEPLKIPENAFLYGGVHFTPYRRFKKGEVERQAPNDSRPWKKDTAYAMRNMRSDFELGISNYEWGKTNYSHAEFYAASGGSDADIFNCVETGRYYIPGENELFEYKEI